MEEPVVVKEEKEHSLPLPEIHLPEPDLEKAEGPEIHLPEPDLEEAEGPEEWETDGEGGTRRIKLIRSHAIRDSVSPPPPGRVSPHSPPRFNSAVEGGGSGSDLRSIVSGSEGGCEGGLAELGDSVSESGRLDTDTPDENLYTDSTGIDLTQFIISTLNKNTKDRMLMLKLETDMTALVKDPKKGHQKFPQMSSYHRMLVHRVAAYFGLDHNVDQTGNCVIVNKTKTTRLPDMKFRDHVPEDAVLSTSEPRRLILKRESCSCDSGDRHSDNSSRRSKSIEEREEDYERAKRRIFNDSSRDHHVQSYKYSVNLGSTKGAIQARSFDIRDSIRDSSDRPQVSKSFSFGGYPAAQHLEPSRSGYKATPPTLSKGQVVWAVSDLCTVPKGSVLINPDTGTPYLNSDGSVYVFDPGNPPRFPGSEDPSSSPHHLHHELSKLNLEGEKMVYQQSWMVSPRSSAPYILVNPVSTLPQYLPYLYPPFQENPGPDLNLAQHNLQSSHLAGPGVLGPGPSQPHPTQPIPVMNQNQVLGGVVQPSLPGLGGAGPPPLPLSNHIPQNGLVQAVQQGQYQYPGGQLVSSPPVGHKPFLFSIHRSPQHSVVIFLQHCPAVLSRLQLVGMLDPFLSGRGQIQYLDPSSQWTDIQSLAPDTLLTNRYPIQIVFDSEDLASQTISSLKKAGFLMEPQD